MEIAIITLIVTIIGFINGIYRVMKASEKLEHMNSKERFEKLSKSFKHN